MEKIRLEHIAKNFDGVPILRDISLSVNESETVVLLGASGSGKTTLLKVINRLIEPDAGKIFINGENILHQKKEQLRRKIGYVIQNSGLLPHLSVKKNIELIGTVCGQPVVTDQLYDLLALIGLDADVLGKFPSELSGGQQQRIGIARALATNPDIILMDEPFSALDNITRGQLQDDFIRLKFLQKKTIILVTHDIQEAFKLGDRIVLIDDGNIQQVGKPIDLLANPSNESVNEFLSRDQFILSLQTYDYEGVPVFDYISDTTKSTKEKITAMEAFLTNQT